MTRLDGINRKPYLAQTREQTAFWVQWMVYPVEHRQAFPSVTTIRTKFVRFRGGGKMAVTGKYIIHRGSSDPNRVWRVFPRRVRGKGQSHGAGPSNCPLSG
jgi:hypothetical protein